MQTITIIALGKLNASYFKAACAEYEKRLTAFCKLNIIELSEEMISEKNASQAVIDKALEKEAQAILNAVPKGAEIVAMCIEGKHFSSEELADYLQTNANNGVSQIAFVIGSSHGLANKIKQTAGKKMSMSKMTFPHQLARVMLLEQIYRACSINGGGKYHK